MCPRFWARVVLMIVVAAVAAVATGAAEEAPVPGPKDRCGVCGMYVAMYPQWIASIRFDDGPTVFFDGPKDMFRFLHDPGRYVSDEVDDDDIVDADFEDLDDDIDEVTAEEGDE